MAIQWSTAKPARHQEAGLPFSQPGLVDVQYQQWCSEGYFGFRSVMQGMDTMTSPPSFLTGLCLDLDLVSPTTFVKLLEPKNYQVWTMWRAAELSWDKQLV